MHPNDRNVRGRLLAAGAAAFAEHGYKAATIREICRRADVGIASVNYYFRDKEGLYLAVYRDIFTRALQEYPPNMGLCDRPKTDERLYAFIRSFLYRLCFLGGRHSLLVRQMLDPSTALIELHAELVTPLQALLTEIVRDLLGPNVTEQDLMTCVTSIVGQCMFYNPHTQRFREHFIDAIQNEHIDHLASAITRFSLGGIQALRQHVQDFTPARSGTNGGHLES